MSGASWNVFYMLSIENLAVSFRRDGVVTTPVRSVSFTISPGERVALVGESGCGKSLTALALVRLAPTDRAHLAGRIIFDGIDLLQASASVLQQVRGKGIAYVFQDPSASLNPVMRVGAQIEENMLTVSRSERQVRIRDLLARVGLPDPARAARAYPCELSGGQQQRVMLAMALAAHPKLLVADEPTTALDVTMQRQVLDLMDDLAAEYRMAVLLITHNLGLVAGRMDAVHVMYAGQIVESGPVVDVLKHPIHPYTRGLLAAVPRLAAPRGAALQDIPGTVPAAWDWPQGCAFAPRCAVQAVHCAATPLVVQAVDAQRSIQCHQWMSLVRREGGVS